MKSRHGFTLIELLVVISIVSILSSVLLASLKSARESARIASTGAFNAHTRHAFGADAESIWTFDDETGVTLKDFTLKHPGTLDDVSMRSAITPANYGNSLYFDGAKDATVGTLTIPKNATVSMWIKTASNANGTFLSVFGGGRTFKFGVQNQASNRRFLVYDSVYNGQNRNYYSNKVIGDGEWHHVVWTTNGTVYVLYIDGVEDKRTARNFSPITGTGTIGSDQGGTTFLGYLDDVAIYTQTLLASDIQNLYFAGLKHRNENVAGVGEVVR
jgi:prepilin-type N-terminal cleavage/methylation domain-containing protein